MANTYSPAPHRLGQVEVGCSSAHLMYYYYYYYYYYLNLMILIYIY